MPRFGRSSRRSAPPSVRSIAVVLFLFSAVEVVAGVVLDRRRIAEGLVGFSGLRCVSRKRQMGRLCRGLRLCEHVLRGGQHRLGGCNGGVRRLGSDGFLGSGAVRLLGPSSPRPSSGTSGSSSRGWRPKCPTGGSRARRDRRRLTCALQSLRIDRPRRHDGVASRSPGLRTDRGATSHVRSRGPPAT